MDVFGLCGCLKIPTQTRFAEQAEHDKPHSSRCFLFHGIWVAAWHWIDLNSMGFKHIFSLLEIRSPFTVPLNNPQRDSWKSKPIPEVQTQKFRVENPSTIQATKMFNDLGGTHGWIYQDSLLLG